MNDEAAWIQQGHGYSDRGTDHLECPSGSGKVLRPRERANPRRSGKVFLAPASPYGSKVAKGPAILAHVHEVDEFLNNDDEARGRTLSKHHQEREPYCGLRRAWGFINGPIGWATNYGCCKRWGGTCSSKLKSLVQ